MMYMALKPAGRFAKTLGKKFLLMSLIEHINICIGNWCSEKYHHAGTQNNHRKACRDWLLMNKIGSKNPITAIIIFKIFWHFTMVRSYSMQQYRVYYNAPVILSRFGRYVVPTLLTPTFRRNWCWFRLGATLCRDVSTLLPRCSHAGATLLSSVDTLDKLLWQV